MHQSSDIENIINNVKMIQMNYAVDTSTYHHYALFFETGVIKWWEKVDSDIKSNY